MKDNASRNMKDNASRLYLGSPATVTLPRLGWVVLGKCWGPNGSVTAVHHDNRTQAMKSAAYHNSCRPSGAAAGRWEGAVSGLTNEIYVRWIPFTVRPGPTALEVLAAAEKWVMLNLTQPVPWLDDATAILRAAGIASVNKPLLHN